MEYLDRVRYINGSLIELGREKRRDGGQIEAETGKRGRVGIPTRRERTRDRVK